MDLSLLAQSITGVLTPALPFLIIGGKKAAEAAGSKIGPEAWEKAKEIWGKLKPEMNEDAEEAAREVAQLQQDSKAQQTLREQIEKILKEKPEVSEEVRAILSAYQKIEELQGEAVGADIGELSKSSLEAEQKIKHIGSKGKAVAVSIGKATGGEVKTVQNADEVEGSLIGVKIDKA